MHPPESAADINRDLWTLVNAQHTDSLAERAWGTAEIVWGLFQTPDATLGVLGDVAGLDVVELGCGTAFLAASLIRAGARPVGVDLTPAQLDTARRCQERFGLSFPLLEADAEDVPLPNESFDLVVSEYGASVWCDPERWVAESARLLRPRGRLVFLTNSVLTALCVPGERGVASDRLERPQKGLQRIKWSGGGVEHHPSHSTWIRILRKNGFVVDALHELYAPDDAATPEWYDIVSVEWAQQWPAEDLWVAHRAD